MSSRAERLNVAIKVRGVTKMMSLAADLGVDESAVSRWRRGGAMSLHHAAMICDLLDVSMDWLVLGRGEMDLHHTPALRPDELTLVTSLRRFPQTPHLLNRLIGAFASDVPSSS
jgi:transcriptional regulator with XRE-family HTH domain